MYICLCVRTLKTREKCIVATVFMSLNGYETTVDIYNFLLPKFTLSSSS